VGKVAFVEGKTDRTRSFSHVTQNTLLGVFVSRNFCCPNYRFLHSEISDLHYQKTLAFTLF
jgi:hypothetical protein